MNKKIKKQPKKTYLRIEKRVAAKRAAENGTLSKRRAASKIQTSIIGRMKGTVLYEADLTQPIYEQWNADFDKF
jgi:hypothetical protein